MEYNDTLFRQQFPEFANTTLYPAALLQAFFSFAQTFIDQPPACWPILNGNALAVALNYMTAHLYVLSQQQNQPGQAPGQNQGGFETSATIDKINVQMLAPPADNMFTWWLAQTPYGQALAALLRMKAAGGVSVGGLPERIAFRKVGGVFL